MSKLIETYNTRLEVNQAISEYLINDYIAELEAEIKALEEMI